MKADQRCSFRDLTGTCFGIWLDHPCNGYGVEETTNSVNSWLVSTRRTLSGQIGFIPITSHRTKVCLDADPVRRRIDLRVYFEY